MITLDEITLDDFKGWFTRDFRYKTPLGSDEPLDECNPDLVTDADLTRAFTEAGINFNEALFSTDDSLIVTFYYLAAHFLVNDFQAAIGGLDAAGYYPVASRSVGSVSESYAIPDWMLRDPVLGAYATTRYGQKYLALIKPLMIGNVAVYQGLTTFS